jgi:tRNA pseudouridine65 synthase
VALKIHYQDDHYIIVEKPAGLATHPQPRVSNSDTVFYRLKEQTGLYLYPIHRLDRPVSGILAFGLTKESVRELKEYWNSDLVEKSYLALAKGKIEAPGIFNFPLMNDHKVPQEAQTEYEPLFNFEDFTLLKVKIHTGRRHQIRRHFSRRMHPLVGDTSNGHGSINREFRSKYNLHRVFLHACSLKFHHPILNEKIEIKSELPDELVKILKDLDNSFKLPHDYL